MSRAPLRPPLCRRAFLRGVGAGGALIPLLAGGDALAGGKPPKRLVLMVTSNGVQYERFWPTMGADGLVLPPDPPELPSIVAPLERHRRRLLFLHGIELRSALDEAPGLGAHDNFVHLLVGGERARWTYRPDRETAVAPSAAGGMSIDQYIARTTMPPVPYPAMALAVQVATGYLQQGRISWAAADRPVTPDEDPYKLFDRLFGGAGMSPETLRAQRRGRKSVLDAVRRDLAAYAQRLGAADRAKIEAHAESVRALERRLDPRDRVHAQARCAQAARRPDPTLDLRDGRNFPTIGRAQMDLAVAALSCDLTRVITFQWGNSGNDSLVFSWLGEEFVGKGDEYTLRQHHDITHTAGRSPEHLRRKCLAERWFVGELASFLDRLAAVPEGDGTLLDSTVVLFVNNMQSGDGHTQGPAMPFLLAGGNHFRMGRLLELGAKGPVPHQRVLASLAAYMGADPLGFGNRAYNTGPLPGLTA